jgi:hypothetical protein
MHMSQANFPYIVCGVPQRLYQTVSSVNCQLSTVKHCILHEDTALVLESEYCTALLTCRGRTDHYTLVYEFHRWNCPGVFI